MYCPKCDNELPEDSAYCAKCGEKVEQSTQEVVEKPDDTRKAWLSNHPLALLAIAIAVIAVVVSACSAGANKKESDSSYQDSPEYIQNAFESCHSTAEHIRAIYSYDLNDDNILSEMELQLFSKAHPRFVLDEAFVEWCEERLQ